jgi:sugar-specific transcriptional regulator TrmB
MDGEELRTTLRSAGLSQYQADAYCALLRLGSASATELADACNVPTARIYDVLRDLEDRGYIETYEGESLQARAADPDTVMTDLRNQAGRLESAATEIEDRWQAPAVKQHRVSIVKRFETVRERAASLIEEADNEVQVATTVEGFESLRPALETALDRGAIVKVCVWTDPSENGTTDPDARTFAGAATEVRHRTLPTPFVALVDRSYTCFAPHAGSINQYGVLVEDRTMTYVFHWYFQTCLWEIWDQVYSARSEHPPISYSGIRECLREIDPLMDEGATIHATVRGHDRSTGDTVELSGRIVDATYSGETAGEGTPPLAQLAGKVTLYLETDDGDVVTVGGWGAVLEDIEATRMTVTDVSYSGPDADADAETDAEAEASQGQDVA